MNRVDYVEFKVVVMRSSVVEAMSQNCKLRLFIFLYICALVVRQNRNRFHISHSGGADFVYECMIYEHVNSI